MLNKLSRKDIELLNILAQTPEGKSALDEYIEQHEKAVKAYKVYRESVVAEVEVKSPNQLRAEVIQRAKDFVGSESGIQVIKRENYYTGTSVEFVVNENKKTVVALMRNGSRKLMAKGIAKCHPDDVFNEYISKAIALGRALGKDVSEFENAVQPNELAVGMVIRRNYYKSAVTYEREIEKVKGEALYYTCGGYDSDIDSVDNLTIINDTNAQYGGVE